MEYYKNTKAVFKGIKPELTEALFNATIGDNALKAGETITIEDKKYTFDYISFSAEYEDWSLSIYFICDDSVIRISDHWSSADVATCRSYNDDSMEDNPINLYAGDIRSCNWTIENGCVQKLIGHYRNCSHWLMCGGICKFSDFLTPEKIMEKEKAEAERIANLDYTKLHYHVSKKNVYAVEEVSENEVYIYKMGEGRRCYQEATIIKNFGGVQAFKNRLVSYDEMLKIKTEKAMQMKAF